MATTLIRNGAFSGALAAIMDGRLDTNATPAHFAGAVNAADAFASEFIVANAALAVPMADADNAQIGQLCAHAAYAILAGRSASSTTAADYLAAASGAAALAKQGAAKLV